MALAGFGAVISQNLLEYRVADFDWPKSSRTLLGLCTSVERARTDFPLLRAQIDRDAKRLGKDAAGKARVCIYKVTTFHKTVRLDHFDEGMLRLYRRFLRRLYAKQLEGHERFHAWYYQVSEKRGAARKADLDKEMERTFAQKAVDYWVAAGGKAIAPAAMLSALLKSGKSLGWARAQRSIAEEFLARLVEYEAIDKEYASLRAKIDAAYVDGEPRHDKETTELYGNTTKDGAQLALKEARTRAREIIGAESRSDAGKVLQVLAQGVPAGNAKDGVRRPPADAREIVSEALGAEKAAIEAWIKRKCKGFKPGEKVLIRQNIYVQNGPTKHRYDPATIVEVQLWSRKERGGSCYVTVRREGDDSALSYVVENVFRPADLQKLDRTAAKKGKQQP